MSDTLNIRNVDANTAVRFRTLAAHWGMSHSALLAKLTGDAFDANMDAIMATFKGDK